MAMIFGIIIGFVMGLAVPRPATLVYRKHEKNR
jgi:hypothetical protein